jgi:hypothetical protein
LQALGHFLGILRDLDAAISKDIRGSVVWDIANITKASPAIITLEGQTILSERDYTDQIERECVAGLKLLREAGDRRPLYSDATLVKIQKLAKLQRRRQRDKLDLIEVIKDNSSVSVGIDTLENILALTGTIYESIGSIVGNLDAITIHHGSEFRVWEEVHNSPVNCRFSKGQLDKVKEALGERVLVYGLVKMNHRGQRTSIQVEDFEVYPKDDELPKIEEMSGLVEDFTGGIPLGEYLEEIRNG